MPFTISHAAVVLPFSRLLARRQLLSAVVIGAMVPDFGVFFPWRPLRVETHSAGALLTFCLPVGLASYWIFQLLIKTAMLELLPEGAYARWRPFASPADLGSIRQWIYAAFGVLAGAVTHLVWDGFTHGDGRGVRMLPMLDEPLIEFGSHHLLGVRLMQDGSSLAGLVVVIGLVWYALRRGHEQPFPVRALTAVERRAWVSSYVVAVIALSIAWLVGVRMGEPATTVRSVWVSVNNMAVASLRGIATALLGLGLILRLRLRAPSRGARTPR
jgi:hypothetical protein